MVSQELIELLKYMEHSTDEVSEQCKSERIQKMRRRVCRIKASEKTEVKYMQAWEEKLQVLEEGLEKGIQLTKKVLKLSAEGRSESEISELCDISPEQVRRILDA